MPPFPPRQHDCSLPDRRRTGSRPVQLVSSVLVAVLLAACGGAVDPGSDPDAEGPSPGGTPGSLLGGWELTAGHGPDGEVVLRDGHPVTLTIDEERWGGTAACNSYGGTVRVDGEQLTVLEVAVTEMACLDDRVMAAEAAYLSAFTAVDRWSADGDTLTLLGADTELVFARQAPAEDAALVGTTWQLTELISGGGPDAAVSSTWADAELLLAEDGSLSGSTGCNRLMSSYELDGEVLVLGEVATTRMACDGGAAQQEEQVLAVLQTGRVEVELDGQRLVIRAADGVALGYRAS